MPLAIELAAARIKILEPSALLERLEHPVAPPDRRAPTLPSDSARSKRRSPGATNSCAHRSRCSSGDSPSSLAALRSRPPRSCARPTSTRSSPLSIRASSATETSASRCWRRSGSSHASRSISQGMPARSESGTRPTSCARPTRTDILSTDRKMTSGGGTRSARMCSPPPRGSRDGCGAARLRLLLAAASYLDLRGVYDYGARIESLLESLPEAPQEVRAQGLLWCASSSWHRGGTDSDRDFAREALDLARSSGSNDLVIRAWATSPWAPNAADDRTW